MADVTLVDLVKITALTTGTGAVTLGDPVPGYRGVEALLDGAVYGYSIQQEAEYEIGRCTYLQTPNQIVRTPEFTSNGGTPINLQANAAIAFVATAEDILGRDVLRPLYGYGAPTNNIGLIGQTYTDKNDPVTLYGPKTAAGWGVGVTLQGNPGRDGAPGGNVMSVGPFTTLASISIPGGTDLVQTSGGSRGILIADTTLTDADVAAHPLAVVKTQNGRYFRRDPRDLWAEDFGADPTGVQDSTPALLAARDYIIRSGRSEDGAAFTRNGPNLRIGIGVFRLNSLVNWRVSSSIIGTSANHEIGRYGTVFRVYGKGGFWFDRADTENGIPISPAKTGANGFSLEDVSLEYAGPAVPDGPGATWGAISSCQGTFRNVTARGFPGYGYAVIATSGAPSGAGEASGFVVDGMTAVSCFKGFRAEGNDVSNLVMRGSLNFGFNRSAGYDFAQLLSCEVANVVHCKFNGNDNTVHFDGMIYQGAWNAGQNDLSVTQPGTNPAVWVPWMAGGASAAGRGTWVSGGSYWPAGAFFSTNQNARTRISTPYTEGGTVPPQAMYPTHIDGGQTLELSRNSTAQWTTYEQGVMRSNGIIDSPMLYQKGKSIVAAAQSDPRPAQAAKVPNAAGNPPTQVEFNALNGSHAALIDDVDSIRQVLNGLIDKLQSAGTMAT